MATFTGTANSESIYQYYVSPSVEVSPSGFRPSDTSDTIYADGGNDYIEGVGGNDTIYTGSGDDTAYGGAGDDYFEDYLPSSFGGSDTFYGGTGNDTIYGWTGYDRLYGDTGNDSLYGEDDNDTLDGGAGSDAMYGGEGGDTYYVDSIGDVAVEDDEDGGYDTVNAAVSFTLGAFLENLTLTGRGAINGTGNDLANELNGTSAANVLTGLGGSDYLSGAAGADTLYGGDGNDTLDGGDGVDAFYGGAGNDTYYVSSTSEVVSDTSGTDTISLRVSTSWTLAQGLENLELHYGGGVDGVGNSAANVITGNGYDNFLTGKEGNDTFYGGYGKDVIQGDAGADTMVGGAGDDVYFADNIGDRIIEQQYDEYYDEWYYYGNGGYDKVYSSITHTLANNVEFLSLTGTAAINGTGNAGDNTIYGTTGSNTLRGLGGDDTFRSGDGADVLIGGLGNDVFQYTNATASNPTKRDVLRAGDGAFAFLNPGNAAGDVFDLREFDADTTVAGVQDFVFGTATGKGRLWATNSGTLTIINGNTDADSAIEFQVAIEDAGTLASAYTSADFLV